MIIYFLSRESTEGVILLLNKFKIKLFFSPKNQKTTFDVIPNTQS